MPFDLSTAETLVVTLADGTALLYPPSAAVISIIKGVLSTLEAAGVIPQETTAVNVEQVRAQVAGIAAAQASAVTSMNHKKETV